MKWIFRLNNIDFVENPSGQKLQATLFRWFVDRKIAIVVKCTLKLFQFLCIRGQINGEHIKNNLQK